ncbi:hypothetical protein MNBD_GAMMA12-1796 [hydrothermal vent metagenome]|uniref:Uncharacterized protein n=1 Tax=hydrothermal vent metagenome TaxID=652676 RepID=A0A3B0XUA0_9ZZZZ
MCQKKWSPLSSALPKRFTLTEQSTKRMVEWLYLHYNPLDFVNCTNILSKLINDSALLLPEHLDYSPDKHNNLNPEMKNIYKGIIKDSEYLLDLEPNYKNIQAKPKYTTQFIDNEFTNRFFSQNPYDNEFYTKIPELHIRLYKHPSRGSDFLKQAWLLDSPYVIKLYGIENLCKMFDDYAQMSMDYDEQAYIYESPEIINVFHKIDSLDSVNSIMSCTLQKEHAHFFSHLNKGMLIKGKVKKSDIYAYYSDFSSFIIKPGKMYDIDIVDNL